MPMGLKVDSTKKVTPGGGSKPSIMIKKETKIRRPTIGGSIPFPERPSQSEKSKNPKGLYDFNKMPSKMKKRFDNFDKSKKVEYKPLPKK
jgi:hypothetical protein